MQTRKDYIERLRSENAAALRAAGERRAERPVLYADPIETYRADAALRDAATAAHKAKQNDKTESERQATATAWWQSWIENKIGQAVKGIGEAVSEALQEQVTSVGE